jgi:hypothetical protein
VDRGVSRGQRGGSLTVVNLGLQPINIKIYFVKIGKSAGEV